MSKNIDKNLKTVARSSIIIFIGVLLSKVLTYVYRVIIAREFGPETYGLFSLVFMILSFLVIIALLGFNEGLLRFISFYIGKKQKDSIKYLFRFSNRLLIATSTFITVLLFMLSEEIAVEIFHNPQLTIYLQFFSLTLPFSVLSLVYLSVVLAYEKVGWFSFLNNIASNVLKIALLLVGILFGLSENSIIFSYCLSAILLFFISYLVIRKVTPEVFGSFNLKQKQKKEIVSKLFSYSWPIIFSGTIYSLFGWLDSFMIGYMQNTTDVGYYNSAFTIITLLGVIPSLFSQIFLPIIVKEYARNKIIVVKELSQQVGKWTIIINLPLFIILILFPEAMINTLFGAEYLSASGALRILAIGGLVSSLTPILFNLFSMMGKSKLLLVNILLSTFLNFFLNWILILKYGINGAAMATTISLVVLATALTLQVKYMVNIIPLRRKVIRVFLVSILPTAVLLYLRSIFDIHLFSIIMIVTSYVLVYILLIFTTGCLDKNDLMIINEIKKKAGIIKSDTSVNG